MHNDAKVAIKAAIVTAVICGGIAALIETCAQFTAEARQRCENVAYHVQAAATRANEAATAQPIVYASNRDVIESQLQLNLEFCHATNR